MTLEVDDFEKQEEDVRRLEQTGRTGPIGHLVVTWLDMQI
jgi:hypothetical protein